MTTSELNLDHRWFWAKNKFCVACGSTLMDSIRYDLGKNCSNDRIPFGTKCHHVTYPNGPLVVAGLLPTRAGLWVGKRADRNEAGYGLWGLPAGHVLPGETWQEALMREIEEEMCMTRKGPIENAVYQHGSFTVGRHRERTIIFGLVLEQYLDVKEFAPNQEVSERSTWRPSMDDLAFPIHTKVARAYLAMEA